MISEDQQLEILSLAAQGDASHREIARRVGVSRGTVDKIIHRGCVRKPSRPPPVPSEAIAVDEYRCGECGYLVVLEPCLICKIRRMG